MCARKRFASVAVQKVGALGATRAEPFCDGKVAERGALEKRRASSALPLCRRAKPEARSVAKGRDVQGARHRRKRARRAPATGAERGDGHRDSRQSRARRSRDPHTSRSNKARAQHTGNAIANSRARPARRRAGLAKRLYSLVSIVS